MLQQGVPCGYCHLYLRLLYKFFASHLLYLSETVKFEIFLSTKNLHASVVLCVENYAIVSITTLCTTINCNLVVVEDCNSYVLSIFENSGASEHLPGFTTFDLK